jgi:hypothetical protein
MLLWKTWGNLSFESFWGAFSFFSLHFYTWVASNNVFQHYFIFIHFYYFFGFREEEAQEEAWRVFDLLFGLLQQSMCGMSKDVGVVNLISTSCNLSMKEGSLFVCFVCTYEIRWTRMLQIVFLVSLESSWWGVHGLGFMMFGLVVQKFLNIEWLFHWKLN